MQSISFSLLQDKYITTNCCNIFIL